MRVKVDFCGEVPEGLREADETLRRYGRWAMQRMHRRSCGSAEGRYRIPQNDEDRTPRELIMPTQDALTVQRALAAVPETERIVLVILYVPNRFGCEAQLRVRHITARACQERHRAGLAMFRNRYAVLVASRDRSATSRLIERAQWPLTSA